MIKVSLSTCPWNGALSKDVVCFSEKLHVSVCVCGVTPVGEQPHKWSTEVLLAAPSLNDWLQLQQRTETKSGEVGCGQGEGEDKRCRHLPVNLWHHRFMTCGTDALRAELSATAEGKKMQFVPPRNKGQSMI